MGIRLNIGTEIIPLELKDVNVHLKQGGASSITMAIR